MKTKDIRYAVFEQMLSSGGYSDDMGDEALERVEKRSDALFDSWLVDYAVDVLNMFFEEMEKLNWSTDVRDVAAARRATLGKVNYD